MRRLSLALTAIAIPAATLAAQSEAPPDWRSAPDRPARLVSCPPASDSTIFFVTMPPGWHAATGPGALLYPADVEARGRYVLEAEIFIFPDATDAEYGVFAGGRELGGNGQRWTGFVLRRDGAVAVLRSGGGGAASPVRDWTVNDAVLRPEGNEPVRNRLRVTVEADSVVMRVNGLEVFTLGRNEIDSDGLVGFRLGAGVNLHVVRLDLTRRFATVPSAR